MSMWYAVAFVVIEVFVVLAVAWRMDWSASPEADDDAWPPKRPEGSTRARDTDAGTDLT